MNDRMKRSTAQVDTAAFVWNAASNRALRFVLLIGALSFFADLTYEAVGDLVMTLLGLKLHLL